MTEIVSLQPRYAWCDMAKLWIVFLIAAFSNLASACLPERPLMVLISAQTFEIEYIYPAPYAEQKYIAKEKNLAVVKVIKTARSNKWSKTVDVAIVEVLHGWGKQYGRYMKAIRPLTLCDSGRVEESGWHLAVIDANNKEISHLIPFSEMSPFLGVKGKPDYVYTPMGLMQ